jgi:hypothetical protein
MQLTKLEMPLINPLEKDKKNENTEKLSNLWNFSLDKLPLTEPPSTFISNLHEY